MVTVSDLASQELNKVMQAQSIGEKKLFVNFMGYG